MAFTCAGHGQAGDGLGEDRVQRAQPDTRLEQDAVGLDDDGARAVVADARRGAVDDDLVQLHRHRQHRVLEHRQLGHHRAAGGTEMQLQGRRARRAGGRAAAQEDAVGLTRRVGVGGRDVGRRQRIGRGGELDRRDAVVVDADEQRRVVADAVANHLDTDRSVGCDADAGAARRPPGADGEAVVVDIGCARVGEPGHGACEPDRRHAVRHQIEWETRQHLHVEVEAGKEKTNVEAGHFRTRSGQSAAHATAGRPRRPARGSRRTGSS